MCKLLRAALTNIANLSGLTALNSALPAGDVGLTPAEAELCRRMALDPAGFLRSKASLSKG